MPLKKILHNNITFGLILYTLGFSGFSIAKVNTVDEQIDQIQKASEAEKKVLVKQLEENISEQKYNNTDSKRSVESNTSIDEKIKNRVSKSIPVSKCGMGRCGVGKCGMEKQVKPDNAKAPVCD